MNERNVSTEEMSVGSLRYPTQSMSRSSFFHPTWELLSAPQFLEFLPMSLHCSLVMLTVLGELCRIRLLLSCAPRGDTKGVFAVLELASL